MAINDPPIHLGCDSRKVEIVAFQRHLDGLVALINYCAGVAAAGQGCVPGSFELLMHYRELASKLRT